MQVHEFLQLLGGVRQNRKGFMALCPAHHDRNPSLSIAQGRDGRVLVKCHAGCDTEDILDSLGLQMAALFPDDGGI